MVWTGREVLVWGGSVPNPTTDPYAGYPRDGAAYDPATRTWRRMPAAPPSPPSLLTAYSAVWTGDLALFVGGSDQNDAGRRTARPLVRAGPVERALEFRVLHHLIGTEVSWPG